MDCTACGYCLPCSSNVNIPGVFTFYNDYHLMDADEAKDRAKFMYKFQVMEAERASKCTHCKACEDKCPQQIAVSDNSEKAAALFGS